MKKPSANLVNAAVKKAAVKKAAVKKKAKPRPAPGTPAAKNKSATPPAAASHTPGIPGPGAAVLDRLHAVILDRRTADPARSHSARLLSRGLPKVAQKFGEEAVECLIEAVAGNPDALVAESADVLYHLLVMWVASGVAPNQVWAELERREGVSGITEKATRALGTAKIP